jgi:type I restriction enzyme M protein
MSPPLNKPKIDNIAGNIWKSAERLRGKVKANEYQSVILPIIVIRWLECVLLAWRDAKSAEVLTKWPELKPFRTWKESRISVNVELRYPRAS